MPRKKNAVPQYLLHPASGQARVRIQGRDIYLGKFDSPESKAKYSRLLAEHYQSGPVSSPKPAGAANGQALLSISQLVLDYDDYARSFYVRDGERTDERYKAFVQPLIHLYGTEPADQFDVLKLEAVRELIVSRGSLRSAEFDVGGLLLKPGKSLCREYVNNVIKALIRMFRWAASKKKVPASIHQELATLAILKKGKDRRLRESNPVRPVPEEHIWPVVEVCTPQIAAMIQVQYWAGGRPDEITIMRPCDISRNGAVWSYLPSSHKLEYHELGREILLGPEAQRVLLPWLEGRPAEAYLFSPREVE